MATAEVRSEGPPSNHIGNEGTAIGSCTLYDLEVAIGSSTVYALVNEQTLSD
jgi:hypothetical protein